MSCNYNIKTPINYCQEHTRHSGIVCYDDKCSRLRKNVVNLGPIALPNITGLLQGHCNIPFGISSDIPGIEQPRKPVGISRDFREFVIF